MSSGACAEGPGAAIRRDEGEGTIGRADTRSGLRRIIVAWAFGSVFFNITGGAPLAAYVRLLGASDFVWGIIAAAPMIGAVSQILASYHIERTRRRKPLFLACGLIHRLLWLPIAALPWLLRPGGRPIVAALLALAVTASLSSQAVGPSFMSWMADLVPLKVRGAFFSRRMRVGTAMALLSSTLAGASLDLWPRMTTYTALFTVAAVCGALDILQFLRVPEPEMAPEPAPAPFRQMAKAPFGDPIFRRFLAFSAAYAFSLNFMQPFLWLFVMERLGMGKLAANLTLLGAGLAAVTLVSPVWGRLTDRFGNRPVLRVCLCVVALAPICWIVATPATAWGLWAVVFISGAFGAGVDLAIFNLTLALFPRERQSIYFAVFAVVVGLSAGIAPMLGGALVDHLRGMGQLHPGGWVFGPYRIIFAISLICRLFTAAVLLPRVREPRAGSARDLLRSIASDLGARWKRARDR